jgi:hypothetical protein
MRKQILMTLLVSGLGMNGIACSLQVEQLLAVQDGSNLDLVITSPIATDPPPQALQGGSVMNIDIRISLFDLILGDFEGDITVGELLIAAPGFTLPLVGNTGALCIVPTDPNDPGSGTFEANLFTKTATFDVSISTIALVQNPSLAALLPGGGLPFPFALQSSVPFGLKEALGLLSGSSDITVTQPIDQALSFQLGPFPVSGHVGGEITLASADAFPTSPLLDTCIALVSN